MSMVALQSIDKADTAWVLVATAMVLMMTLPGLALFYAGLVRKKNVVNTLMSVFAIACVVTLLWFAVGYSLAFTAGSSWLGGLGRAGFMRCGRCAVPWVTDIKNHSCLRRMYAPRRHF